MFVCFSTQCLEKRMQLGSLNLTQKCSTMRLSNGNPFIIGSKVKVTRHINKSKSTEPFFRWNTILLLAGYVSYAGFCPLQYPATQAMIATPGFPASLLCGRCCCWPPVFPCMEIFAVSQQLKYCRRGSWHPCVCWLLVSTWQAGTQWHCKQE